jgi:hypothetical protein
MPRQMIVTMEVGFSKLPQDQEVVWRGSLLLLFNFLKGKYADPTRPTNNLLQCVPPETSIDLHPRDDRSNPWATNTDQVAGNGTL